jgi:hypothetical protein
MKTLLASLALLFVFRAFAEENPKLAAVQAADKARVAAMRTPTTEALTATCLSTTARPKVAAYSISP